ncbi:hypothetical protein NN561_001467 [Cricetulus griseus]
MRDTKGVLLSTFWPSCYPVLLQSPPPEEAKRARPRVPGAGLGLGGDCGIWHAGCPHAHCSFLAVRFGFRLGQAGAEKPREGGKECLRDCTGEPRWPWASDASERNGREIEMQRAFFGKRHTSTVRGRLLGLSPRVR